MVGGDEWRWKQSCQVETIVPRGPPIQTEERLEAEQELLSFFDELIEIGCFGEVALISLKWRLGCIDVDNSSFPNNL